MTTTIAAYIFAALTSITILFQLGLALGLPWGHLAWGGKYPSVLPQSMRYASLFAILLLVLFCSIVWARAGLILPQWHSFSRVAIWFVVAYSALGCLGNAATPSRWERLIWLPITIVLLITSVLIALS
jgi:hypothetical protein